MTYNVIGTGAVGGFYGSRLAKAGKEVNFLFHSDYEYVKEHGLTVNSCEGDYHIDNVRAYHRASDMPLSDVVIVALKTTNNHLLRQLLKPLLGDNTLVLLIQNGIGVEQEVQSMFPKAHLAAGLAFICSAKTQPGVIDHQCYGSINVANFSCPDEQSVDSVVADFQKAGIMAAKVEYLEARWKKAVWNMPFNGLTVALHTQTDRLLAHPSTLRLVREMMMEVVGAAKALGAKNVDEPFVEKMISMTCDMVPYSPSMRLDYDFHRPMELEFIYHRPIQMAREAGFDMPKLAMLADELDYISHTQQ